MQHIVNEPEARAFLEGLKYGTDVRNPPDNWRRGQFRRWCRDGAQGETMAQPTLDKKLTWANLGYRAGRHYTPGSDEMIDAMFDVFASIYRREGRPARQRRAG